MAQSISAHSSSTRGSGRGPPETGPRWHSGCCCCWCYCCYYYCCCESGVDRCRHCCCWCRGEGVDQTAGQCCRSQEMRTPRATSTQSSDRCCCRRCRDSARTAGESMARRCRCRAPVASPAASVRVETGRVEPPRPSSWRCRRFHRRRPVAVVRARQRLVDAVVAAADGGGGGAAAWVAY